MEEREKKVAAASCGRTGERCRPDLIFELPVGGDGCRRRRRRQRRTTERLSSQEEEGIMQKSSLNQWTGMGGVGGGRDGGQMR